MRVLVLFAATLGVVWPARAGDANYQSHLVGGRAVCLGGAFTSLADDASGIVYNPAGIADVRHQSVQLSTSLYGFERRAIDDQSLTLPVPGLESLQPKFTELVIIPASAGFVDSFGPLGADGRPNHAYGVTVNVPAFTSYTVTDPRQGPSAPPSAALEPSPPLYSRRVSDRSLWGSAAYAFKATPELRLGIAGHYVFRTYSDLEEVTLSAKVRNSEDTLFRSARNEVSVVTGSVHLSAGAKWAATDRLNLGLMLQSPSVPLHSLSSIRVTTSESVPSCSSPECAADPAFAGGPRSRLDVITLEDADAETAQPFVARFGASWVEPARYTVSIDGTLHLPVQYDLVAVSDDIKSRLAFEPHIERRAVFNLNVGGEYLVVRDVSLSAGFFTDFSSAPRIPATPTHDYLERINQYGMTLALGYFGTHSLLRLGVLYSFGRGKDVLPSSDLSRLFNEGQDLRRVDYFRSFFYVFVSSSFRY